ncbi:hypothetical protein DE146DRAFT_754398 [Phaeosphaeria sp. MPI-PUGE-AT-0046c]|nr:hypothetical protein DE146DRAFT_754398 [Phaeosphaeria sp. MPI-PUGE-AT-0046c]
MKSTDTFSDKVTGYPKLAAKFGAVPEAAMYRRFGALGAQDLLYYQAELEYLERRLQEQQQVDNNQQRGRGLSYALNWYWLKHSKPDGDGRQYDLVMQIRKVLKQYNKAFIQQATILGYAQPSKWDLHNLQDYLHSDEMGCLALLGVDAAIWSSRVHRDPENLDLVVLRARAKTDAFSRWAAETTVFDLFRRVCSKFMKPSKVHGSIYSEDSRVLRITYWITSILASLIPITSIAILYQVQSMSARLGIIAVFNMLLSICLVGLANANRAEVFAITAAFAAVQVVFVSADKSQ